MNTLKATEVNIVCRIKEVPRWLTVTITYSGSRCPKTLEQVLRATQSRAQDSPPLLSGPHLTVPLLKLRWEEPHVSILSWALAIASLCESGEIVPILQGRKLSLGEMGLTPGHTSCEW